MKDLIISILIIALLIGSWLIFDGYSKQTTTLMAESLEANTIPLVENELWEEATLQYERFEKNWNKYKKTALSFLENDQISEIDLCVARAEKYIEAKDVSNSAGELCSIAKQLHLLDLREKVTLSNIL